jgi:hypothetical protein
MNSQSQKNALTDDPRQGGTRWQLIGRVVPSAGPVPFLPRELP